MSFLGLVPRSLWLALVAAALAAAAFWATYAAGGSAVDARWHAREAQAAVQANRKLLAAFEQGIAASEGLRVALTSQAASYNELQRAFNDLPPNTPLVVTRTVVRTIREPAAGQLAQSADPASDVGAAPELSRAALWMWNSALAGADVPADTCGLTDTSDGACAPASGATVEAALANHGLNAHSCAVDRLRYQQLLDLLSKRQAGTASSLQP